MRSLLRILALLTLLTVIGTSWFCLVQGWSLVDAVYMTVITLSTAGFTEVRPLHPEDKVFVSVFLVASVGVFLYGVVQLGELVVRAELGQWWRQRNMSGAINALHGHFIICGGGRMGKLLCEDLAARDIPFVVIDSNEDVVEMCRDRGWPALCSDATDDETLVQAGIDRAAGLATMLSERRRQSVCRDLDQIGVA